MYLAGTVLKIDCGAFFHYGVADGVGNVIHNSKKNLQVTHESYHGFSDGKEIFVSDITSQNPTQAAINAQRYIGMPYSLIKSNCEHFVRLCHGLEVESTQIQQYILVALGAGAALKSNNAIIQAAGSSIAIASLLTPTEESPFKNAAIAGLVAAGLVALARA